MNDSYKYIDKHGSFLLKNADRSSYLYFPLCNDAGLKASITPRLHGDLKLDQNTFALQPVSIEDLHNSNAARNFWVKINGEHLWSLTGNSAAQKSIVKTLLEEETTVEAGFLYHKVTRYSKQYKVKSIITSFVPSTDDLVELNKFTIVNESNKSLTIEPTSAIPIYGRSADNYRDHRHVTSLLNELTVNDYGVSVNATLSFDERGHLVNDTYFGVVGSEDGNKPIGVIPTLEEFIGEGGSLDWPNSILGNRECIYTTGQKINGYEAMGALCFNEVTLKPGEEKSFYTAMFIGNESTNGSEDVLIKKIVKKYCNEKGFSEYLENNKHHWIDKVEVVKIESSVHGFDSWMKWVNLQPILRRIYGCSFLPHHDYGRGGRGWRDLWQDSLALLLMEPQEVRFLLKNNFAGVRIDGTNATIIGDKPGEFVADRNNISRTWMDHGAWPWLTTKEYIHQSGDIDFLFEQQVYFKDKLISRSTTLDNEWDLKQGNKLLTVDNSLYTGTILEHLIVQNVSIFYNVGDHNILQLEDADWNDALDMASDKGESVSFTSLYTNNLRDISKLLKDLKVIKSIDKIELAEEIVCLFEDMDYSDIKKKHELLSKYFNLCKHQITGKKVNVPIDTICKNIDSKVDWLTAHLQGQEFISSKSGHKWFNSYYDNNGLAVEGDFKTGTRMMLTGQVFALMGNISTDKQSVDIVKSCKEYLYDKKIGGYRLNTNFNELKSDLGRAFGFAFGHKENGAMFSHMAVMYCNALYKRGFIKEAYELICDLYEHCNDFDVSRIYPSVPEYINERGRGMYTYLTGSASWLLYTIVCEMYGCKGLYGDLFIDPKLLKEQFDNKKASITFLFNNLLLTINYELSNDTVNDIPKVKKVLSKGIDITLFNSNNDCVINREVIKEIQMSKEAVIKVIVS